MALSLCVSTPWGRLQPDMRRCILKVLPTVNQRPFITFCNLPCSACSCYVMILPPFSWSAGFSFVFIPRIPSKGGGNPALWVNDFSSSDVCRAVRLAISQVFFGLALFDYYRACFHTRTDTSEAREAAKTNLSLSNALFWCDQSTFSQVQGSRTMQSTIGANFLI